LNAIVNAIIAIGSTGADIMLHVTYFIHFIKVCKSLDLYTLYAHQ